MREPSTDLDTQPDPLACPACAAPGAADAAACLECGFLFEREPKPGDCPYWSCREPNPPGARFCARCGTPLPLAAGTILAGRYAIEAAVALNEFGNVYRAADLAGGGPVAVREVACSDADLYALALPIFLREAELRGELQSSPLLPRVLGFVEEVGAAYSLEEFVEGQTAEERAWGSPDRVLPLEEVIRLARLCCDLLARMHAHSPPLIRAGLAPWRLVYQEKTEAWKAFVALSPTRMAHWELEARRRAVARKVVWCGPNMHLSPEEMIGKAEPRSDLCALAKTLCVLAAGTWLSFGSPEVLADWLASADCSVREGDRWFFELLRINLSEAPNDRYYSAAAFRADLDRRTVTRTTDCPGCGQANPIRCPYCEGCGVPLTEWAYHPCPHCGERYRMGSRCCTTCGNGLGIWDPKPGFPIGGKKLHRRRRHNR